MRFIKPNAIALGIVEGREENADMANMACLGSDLMKEWGDVGAVWLRLHGGEYFKEMEKIIGIE